MDVVLERNEDSWIICNHYEVYTVTIPAKITWNTAKHMCGKLGGGHITGPQIEDETTYLMSLFENMNSSCEYMWTAFSDEKVEGEFRNSMTGELATYLPWLQGQPDGADTENHVAVQVKSKLWKDAQKKEEYCSACDLHKSLVFTLIGVCKITYFGKYLYITTQTAKYHFLLMIFLNYSV